MQRVPQEIQGEGDDMTLTEWYAKCERGTRGDMVYSILGDWKADREVLVDAIESALATWDANAPGRGLTERQALRKLKAAVE